jgi:cardiolipin synthase
MLIAFHILIQTGLILRVLLHPNREPSVRLTWIVVILALPVFGILTYLMLGEARLRPGRLARHRAVLARLPPRANLPEAACADDIPGLLFRVGQSISGFAPVDGNTARLMSDAEQTITSITADIDAAQDHVHLMCYIWLPDDSGSRLAHALIRASGRGVTCRALADDFGARAMIRDPLWAQMQAAGVRVARSLPVGNAVLQAVFGRIDLRNHRKIVVIDNSVTYCGSQNCADAAFLPKARFAPWVDAVLRLTGPIARQNQMVFAADWMVERPQDDLTPLLMAAMPTPAPGFPAQVVAMGPMDKPTALPELFAALLYAARRELILTTPYFVPVDALQSALRAAANRGVAVTLILPAWNDDFAVAAASRSYYADLIDAGVRLYEYNAGLLHAKTVTVDGQVSLIGSANMDCRSFALNFESNILLSDVETTSALRARQIGYLSDSTLITAQAVAAWPWHRQLWNNAMAILGPVL